MGGKVFINYRQHDSRIWAGRLYERLLRDLKREQIFMDIAGIEAGMDFVAILDEQVAQCNVFLAIIGPQWLASRDETGRCRLDDPNDFVRLELEAALRREVRVIPILVEGASMPKPEALPESLRPLARRQAVKLTHDGFSRETNELASLLTRLMNDTPRAEQGAITSKLPTPDAGTNWRATLVHYDGQEFTIVITRSGESHHIRGGYYRPISWLAYDYYRITLDGEDVPYTKTKGAQGQYACKFSFGAEIFELVFDRSSWTMFIDLITLKLNGTTMLTADKSTMTFLRIVIPLFLGGA